MRLEMMQGETRVRTGQQIKSLEARLKTLSNTPNSQNNSEGMTLFGRSDTNREGMTIIRKE